MCVCLCLSVRSKCLAQEQFVDALSLRNLSKREGGALRPPTWVGSRCWAAAMAQGREAFGRLCAALRLETCAKASRVAKQLLKWVEFCLPRASHGFASTWVSTGRYRRHRPQTQGTERPTCDKQSPHLGPANRGQPEKDPEQIEWLTPLTPARRMGLGGRANRKSQTTCLAFVDVVALCLSGFNVDKAQFLKSSVHLDGCCSAVQRPSCSQVLIPAILQAISEGNRHE